MTGADIKRKMETVLGEMGMTFGYGDLEDPVSPFISWYIEDTAIRSPEGYGGVTVREDAITVELYTTGKNFDAEDRLEALLEPLTDSIQKHEEKNYYEAVYQITYTFTLISKNRRI